MPRLSDIFELVDAHLKKIGRNGLLPAGIVLTGGGSGITTIEDLARGTLKLPSKRSEGKFESSKGAVKDAMWAVAYGLCILAFATEETAAIHSRLGIRLVKSTTNSLSAWFRQFLP